MRTIVGFFNHKIYLLFVLLFAICLVNISCKENNKDKSNPYVTYLLVKDSGYNGTYEDF